MRLPKFSVPVGLMGFWIAMACPHGLAQPAATRLDRTDLLQYRDAAGKICAGHTDADWKIRRAEILAAMQEVMGPLPGKEKRCPLEVKIEETTDCGSYDRQLLTYSSEPGSRVPAYLLIPKSAQSGKVRLRAMLALHPTDDVIGFQVTVGLGVTSYPAYGKELAERGYVVLVPSYPLLAKYQPDLKKLGYQSGTMKAIWDNIRGVDLLQSLPYVDGEKIGAIGHSLGGHNAIYTAVFEPRLKAVVSSCGFDSYLDYQHGNITGWTSERYMPRLRNYSLAEIPFDFYELAGALAPRPFFINAPKRDSNFNWQSVDRIVAAAAVIYKLEGAADNLRVDHPDCAHDFPDAIRKQAYEFLDNALR